MTNTKNDIRIEEFKEILLEIERENISRIKPNDRKKMVAHIMKQYETYEEHKYDNK